MAKRIGQPKDYVCLECGNRMTLGQAERLSGCPECHGVDIDLYINTIDASQNKAHNASLYASARGYYD